MKRPKITKLAAGVIAGRNAQQMGPEWKHDVRTDKIPGGEELYVPTIFHSSGLIGIHYIPDDGWVASVGLKSETASSSMVLIRSYSDLNRSPRLAALECLHRMSKMIHGFRSQFEILDQIDRMIQRLEWPEKTVPDVPTFDSCWAEIGRPPGFEDGQWAAVKDIAAAIWEAKP